MNTIALKTAAVAATAAFIITLVGCSPIAHPPALTVAVTATSAEPAPETASIEHLLEMKRAANRPKDQLDIAALEKIQRGEDPNG